jgi:hypothetical protein
MMRAALRQVIVLGALAFAACGPSKANGGGNDAGVGRVCDQTIMVDSGPLDAHTIAVVMSPVLECPSQICLLAAMEKPVRAELLCTQPCTSDTDCAGGERGDPNDLADKRCKMGFACMIATTVGNYACQKLCTCVDSLIVPAGGFQTPAVCQP